MTTTKGADYVTLAKAVVLTKDARKCFKVYATIMMNGR